MLNYKKKIIEDGLSRHAINMTKIVKHLIIGLFLLIILIEVISSIRVVDAGTVQVVKRWGKVSGQQLNPGFHLILPFADSTETLMTKKVIYETTSKAKQVGSQADYKDFPVDTNTSDGQQVDIFYTVRFSIDSTKASWIVQNIGSEQALVEKVVKTESRIWTRNVPREFEAAELYTGNVVEVQNKIQERLKQVFADNGLILDAIGIREIKFTQEYVKSIEDKQIAAVQVETSQNRAAQAEFEKERRITEAEGQAREQELQRSTISDQLLEKMWIEKWDGKLPTYMLGDSQSLIQLPN